jgi:mono/diheme cytochrome c family protein
MRPRLKLMLLALIPMALIVAACGGSTQPPAQEAQATPAMDVARHMSDHFARVREVEEAIIRGDVEAAKAPALWIADHQETAGLPADTALLVTEMKAAAKAVASTDSIGNAAVAASSLVASCGACHMAAKVTPRLPELIAPTVAADTASHMKEHQYAVDLMYRGLVGPSDASWKQGATALKTAPLGGKDLPQQVSKDAVVAEARVHELAERAVGATDRGARIAIYGEIIGGCASCHGLHGRVWGPGLPKTQ